MYTIEKDVPLPPSKGCSNPRPPRWPLDGMDVGDSFAVPCQTAALVKRRRAAILTAGHSLSIRRGDGRRYTTRTSKTADGWVVRCWRIA